MLRSQAMVPSTASRVLLRVQQYTCEGMRGHLYNPFLGVGAKFVDVVDLARRLDAMFDHICFPQASMQYRSFEKKARRKARQKEPQGAKEAPQATDECVVLNENDENVFIMHVQFRQNATWQGTIKKAGQLEERRFRSTLELLKIMDSLLNFSTENGDSC